MLVAVARGKHPEDRSVDQFNIAVMNAIPPVAVVMHLVVCAEQRGVLPVSWEFVSMAGPELSRMALADGWSFVDSSRAAGSVAHAARASSNMPAMSVPVCLMVARAKKVLVNRSRNMVRGD